MTRQTPAVGFFSPLPPARTGVADYSAALLGELRRHGPVDVAPARSHVALYHLGNNGQHAAIYRRALETPGVIVLHDAVLHHFLLGQLDRAAYIQEFVYNYGEWNRSLAADLWRERAASGSDPRYFAYPMLRRIAERALAVIVHNPAAAAAVQQHAPAARVVEIPHLFHAPALPSESQALRFRQRLGAGAGTRLFGVFGYLRESKRLFSVIQAFAKVHAELPQTALLIAGAFASTDLARAVQPLLSAPGIIRLPYLKEREFWLAASALDAGINLRYPAAGESSGIAIRLMGLGKPVMLTDSAECARFPEDACIRIPSGPAEADSLRAHLILLTSMSVVARAIGRRGARHIRQHHRVESIGNRYWELLSEYCT
ncbi:MAG: glycosyltransferase [Candidatus Sulfopaludibacter sp.]|nr:glycosyltransferase [Candidatus Sulfopaludibacter sp.]